MITELSIFTLANPKLPIAEYPAPHQQRRYLLQGAIATLLVTTLVLVSLAVS